MRLTVPIVREHEKVEPIVDEADASETALVPDVAILLEGRRFEIEPLHEGEVHPVLGTIGASLLLVPCRHFM
jgi:hypothetical protein